jgi:hypothetical protein
VTLFPFAAFLPSITTAALLGALWSLGELSVRALFLLGGWFLLAAYAQFFAASTLASLAGLLAQTALAVYLVFRWKLAD